MPVLAFVRSRIFETHWRSGETDRLAANVCLSLLINKFTPPKQDAQPTDKKNPWVTLPLILEERNIIEDRLTALLKQFLGSMDQSSLAYQNWYKAAGEYIDNASGKRSRIGLPLCQVFKQLLPCSRAALVIVRSGFYKTLRDWWTVGFADINQKKLL